jgi:hypothetical protein
MTLEELRVRWPRAAARICNGVGPAFAQRLLPWLWIPWSKLWFNVALYDVACVHDLAYFSGGHLLEKLAADAEFCAGGLRLCCEQHQVKRYVLACIVLVDAVLIRTPLGLLAWKWGKRPDLVRALNELENKP